MTVLDDETIEFLFNTWLET